MEIWPICCSSSHPWSWSSNGYLWRLQSFILDVQSEECWKETLKWFIQWGHGRGHAQCVIRCYQNYICICPLHWHFYLWNHNQQYSMVVHPFVWTLSRLGKGFQSSSILKQLGSLPLLITCLFWWSKVVWILMAQD
jgi:hypothetical protein